MPIKAQHASSSPAASDSERIHFAIRSVTSELTPQGYRAFKVNGKPFLIRGGGWTPDMMLRQDPKRLQAELDYVRHMNLNTVRLEGKLETDEFFDLADRMGIMVMAGWCCCDFWEKWPTWQPGDVDIAAASLADQIRRLRNHPSVLMWLNGSDNPPPAEVEQRYISVLEQYNWPNPYISSATAKPTTVTGASGVKMSGPYDFVPPNYWLTDTERKWGGAWGFNTETSPGPAIPPAEIMRKILPPDHLWPVDDWWNYHAGAGTFKQFDIYNAALDGRYGASKSMEEFTVKSQAAAYDGERAMFEAYTLNRYGAAGSTGTATGVIQWMLNNAWPSVIWHLYDYFLMPAGGYFGTKKALEPIHVMLNYNDGGVMVSNFTQEAAPKLRVRARVLNFDMTEKWSQEQTVDLAADSVVRAFFVPQVEGLSPTCFLDLRLSDDHGREISSNFYWTSTKADILDWDNSKYFYTPMKQMADLTQLNSLPPVKLQVTRGVAKSASAIPVTVKNPSKDLAFMVRLRVTNGAQGDDILPVRWDDNYFSLLPGESRGVDAVFDAGALTGKTPVVKVEGWNVVAAEAPQAAPTPVRKK